MTRIGVFALTDLMVLFAAMLLFSLWVPVHARPPPGGPTPEAEWFRSLKQPNGGSCCAETADGLPDCHRLDDNMVRMVGNHYEFLASRTIFLGNGDDRWHEIPNNVLIRGRRLADLGGNITGRWVVCAMYGYGGGGYGQSGLMVLCAVPPSGV